MFMDSIESGELRWLEWAFACHDSGNVSVAEKLYERILSFLYDADDLDHKAIIACSYGLADVHVQNGNLKEAAKLYKQVADLCTRNFGETHITTCLALRSLAEVYATLNNQNTEFIQDRVAVLSAELCSKTGFDNR